MISVITHGARAEQNIPLHVGSCEGLNGFSIRGEELRFKGNFLLQGLLEEICGLLVCIFQSISDLELEKGPLGKSHKCEEGDFVA